MVALTIASVGCSSEEPAESKPQTTATAEAAVTEPTRKQGADQYEEIVKQFNEALEKCVPSYSSILESGESTPSDFPKIRAACSDMPGANRQFAEDLTSSSWPSEAQKSVDLLADEVRAEQLAWQELSEVRGHEGLFDPKHGFNEETTTADMVRAHLGLPAVEEIEEESE
ncbi:hypothetical protein ABZ353_10805 [Streptomyces niveus]|uniref:hypothetical protein n=1 Tax=Streptomyces niveus TaxID=193462 RepID=UPI0033CB0317